MMPPTTQSKMSMPGPASAPGGSRVTAINAPNGSARPESVAIIMAFPRSLVASKTGIAMAIPSGMLCTAIAAITTTPRCSLCRDDTPTASPSGKLCAVSASIIRNAKRHCLTFASVGGGSRAWPFSGSAQRSSSFFPLQTISGSLTNLLSITKLRNPKRPDRDACSHCPWKTAGMKSSTKDTVSITPAASANAKAMWAAVGEPRNSSTMPAPSEVERPATKDRRMAVPLFCSAVATTRCVSRRGLIPAPHST
mmetsp:Transcript_25253/g.55072  ORF Transcript_25253/g.55072 Transcript_25253/m.55072 type:complete len:252 (-) Transcript_25253:205-960(-)